MLQNIFLLEKGTQCHGSLYIVSSPLMRRNSLVNQVKFLGLVHTVATVSQKHFMPNPLKKGTQVDFKNFTVVREVVRNNYKPKKFDFVHQTVSRWEACPGWA